MKKTRKWIIIILVIAMVVSLSPAVAALFGSFHKDDNTDVLKPLNKYISTLYYKEGDYSDYKTVFLHPEKALDKASFDAVRETTTAQDYFKFDSSSPESLMKHMVVDRQSTKVMIYYLKDIKSLEERKTAKTWTLVKKSGNWLIEN